MARNHHKLVKIVAKPRSIQVVLARRKPAAKAVQRLRISMTQFSELSGQASCNQEYAGSLKQGLNNEAEPV